MRLVAATVTRLLDWGSVIAPTVRLGDEPKLGPEEVDAEPSHPLLGEGRWEPGEGDESQKPPLEL
jgi:hypothetical protein